MTSENWRTAWELYSSVRELPPAERTVFLNSLHTDPEVLEELTLLLEEPEEEPPSDVSHHHELALASFGMGRYSLLDYLGKGGVSEVYSALDQQLERTVALKFLQSGKIDQRSAECVMREAKTLSGLNHPNVVTVYEVIQSASGLAIVMELVGGTTLRSLCGRPLPENQVLRLGQQIAQALAAAHALGIVHHDIKPENVLVRPDEYVKVVDFGLARQIAATESTLGYGLTVGTLRYMSPEQARADPLSPATDIFSLGLVLYELISGDHPFAGASPLETAFAISTKPLPSLRHKTAPTIDCRLDKLIAAMLAKNPAERPSAVMVAEELGRILSRTERSNGVAAGLTFRGRTQWLAVLVLALIAVAVAVWFVFNRRSAPELADLAIQPLTSQAGWEYSPALSPDGRSIAFTWADKLTGARNIYVRRLSEDAPVKLTGNSEGIIGYIAWSPDSQRIAFKYSRKVYTRGYGSIYSIEVSGNKQQKLLDLVNSDLSSSLDWSPDGTELAFSDAVPGTDRLALYLLDLRTGKERRLTSPPTDGWGDWNPKFSPDGSTLAFKRVTGFWVDDLYLIARAGGTPKRLTAAKRGIWGHAWMPDGKSLIVSCQRTGSIFGIWRFPLASNAQPERVSLAGIDAITPTVSRKHIAWVSQLWDLNIYRIATTGKTPPVRLIASTLRDQGAAYSSEGRIAFVSDRSGSREVWLANKDGSGQFRVTNLNGPSIDSLVWSPDGRQLAFDILLPEHKGIFTLRCDEGATSCGPPQRLTSGSAVEAVPSWSRDGRFVYFAALRTDQWEVWKRPVLGGSAVQVTHGGGYASRESSDGKWLYFSKPGIEAIFRMPLSSSPQAVSNAELVIGPPYRPQPIGWALTRNEIIFLDRSTEGRSALIRAYNPSAKAMRSIVALSEVFADRPDIGLSVSSDDQWILYSQLDRSGSNIMLAEIR